MEDETLVAVPKVISNAILDIEKMAEGRSRTVETDADWKLIEALFKYWAFVNKEDFQRFVRMHKDRTHGALYNDLAQVKEKGGAHIRQVGHFPGNFVKIVNSYYPEQQFEEKKFQLKLVERFPLFKVPNKL